MSRWSSWSANEIWQLRSKGRLAGRGEGGRAIRRQRSGRRGRRRPGEETGLQILLIVRVRDEACEWNTQNQIKLRRGRPGQEMRSHLALWLKMENGWVLTLVARQGPPSSSRPAAVSFPSFALHL